MSYEDNERLDRIEANINKAFAKLNMIELVLELAIAEGLARASTDNSLAWKTQLLRLIKCPTLPDIFTTASEQIEAEIVKQSTLMAQQFIVHVTTREIRFRPQINPENKLLL